MVDILQQFQPDKDSGIYIFAEVLSVQSGGIISVRTTTGLDVVINDSSQDVGVGDQLVLGSHDGSMNSVFIIRKIDRIYPTAVNVVIASGVG